MSTTNEQGYIWDEVLPEVIEEVDWSGITSEQWDEIGDQLNRHIANSHEYMPPTPSGEEIYAMNHRGEVGELKAQILRLEQELEVHVNSVKARRGAAEVYVEGKRVMYR
ncbi:hypothetical protein [Cryobacterium soli]|uniref:hypothetical protein n=1 Tax=Cryobacterium soli TaxID=2220095 RepID=UPI000E771114|nr:hypothetical protein [Cryobacterium soli]